MAKIGIVFIYSLIFIGAQNAYFYNTNQLTFQAENWGLKIMTLYNKGSEFLSLLKSPISFVDT